LRSRWPAGGGRRYERYGAMTESAITIAIEIPCAAMLARQEAILADWADVGQGQR